MTTQRWRLTIAALFAVAVVGAVLWYWQRCPSEPGIIQQVECSHRGGNATNDYSWNLKLDGAGNGTLTVNPGATEKRQALSVPKKIAELQQAIGEYHLCELPTQIGGPTADASSDRLRIKTTTLDKSITIDFVNPSEVNDDDRRAYRILKIVQGCVADHANASK
jgi:hypothetical protein